MLRRTVVVCLTAAILVGAAWVGQALAQPAPGEGPPQRDPEQMRQRMEQFRQQMSDRQREALGVSEEEWKVLQPKIEKVATLSRQTRGGMFGMMGRGGRGGRPGEGRPGEGRPGEGQPGGQDQQQSEVEKAAAGLRTVLENKEAPAEQIKAALTALRDARAKSAAELETARKELREVVTLRQEAILVTMTILD